MDIEEQIEQAADVDAEAAVAREAAKVFVQNNGDYVVCPENFEKLRDYMIARGMAPNSPANFTEAFDALKVQGELRLRYIEPAVTEQPEVEETPAVAQPEPEPVEHEYSESEVEKMTSAEYAEKVLKARPPIGSWRHR